MPMKLDLNLNLNLRPAQRLRETLRDRPKRKYGRGSEVCGEYSQEGTKERELDRKWEIVVFV